MSLSRDSFIQFFSLASTHSFANSDGVFFCSYVLHGDIRYGLSSKGYLLVLFPKRYYLNSFSIGDSFRYGPPSEYHSEQDAVVYSGVPFLYLTRNLDNQFALLSVFCNLVSTGDPLRRLQDFFVLLQSASLHRQEFSAVGLFGELVVIDLLLKMEPSFLDDWQPSGQSVVDIIPSSWHPAIEIKSTSSSDSRIHILSLHQVRYFCENSGSLLASVQVHELQGGTSCKDVVENLLAHLSPDSNGYLYLTQLLVSFLGSEQFNDTSFDVALTQSTIKFYNPDFSLLLQSPIPPWLVSARFSIDFSHFAEAATAQLLSRPENLL
jgi:hypothetical protein